MRNQLTAYIDAVIFLLIFLGVGKSVFMDHFKSGGKAVYVAVGLALTLGLMMWEERMNRSLISELGPWGLAILVIVILAGCYIAALNLSERFTGRRKHWLAIALTVVFVTTLGVFFPDTQQVIFDILLGIWNFILFIIEYVFVEGFGFQESFIRGLLNILILVVLLGFIVWAWLFRRRGP